jgi:hypothetical protein
MYNYSFYISDFMFSSTEMFVSKLMLQPTPGRNKNVGNKVNKIVEFLSNHIYDVYFLR